MRAALRGVLLIAALGLFQSAWGAYQWCAPLTPTSSTSGTQTDFTQIFKGNDVKFQSYPTGAIRNTTTRNGITVPADFLVTTDSHGGPGTIAFKYGFEDSGLTSGTPILHVKFPSLTTTPPTVYGCIGDLSVTMYQGGAAGSEYDSSTTRVHPFLTPGGTLSNADYGPSQVNCTLTNTPTAQTGKIDGAMGVTAGSSQYCATTVTTAGYPPATWSGWIKITTTSGDKTFFGNTAISTGLTGGLEIRVDASTNKISMLRSQNAFVFTTTGAVTTNTFAFIVVSCDALGNLTVYRDAAAKETFFSTQVLAFQTANAIWIGANSFGENFTGVLDGMRIDSLVRGDAWAATTYANQNNPPTFGPFVANSVFTPTYIF